MKARKILFWSHLVSGVIAGVVILFLSVTGVLLTYEQQILTFFEKSKVSMTAGQSLKTADELVTLAKEVSGGKASAVVFDEDSSTLLAVQVGRGQHSLLNPYTGENIENAKGARQFFSTVTALHRWFALEGKSRGVGKAITGAANLVFLFLLLSGIYLWLPKVWRWSILKTKMLFGTGLPSAKARDYNWHHVMSFWTFIPLFVVITTATVFSYGWANKLVFAAFGEEAPKRGGPPRSSDGGSSESASPAEMAAFVSLDQLLQRAKNYKTGWNTIALDIPSQDAGEVNFKLDYGSGRQPQKVTNVLLDRVTGEVIKVSGFDDRSPGMQARIYIRFLHTGETLGVIGQTIAGLSSLAACFLVYTGLALAYRRLILPLFRKESRRRAAL